MSRPVRAGVIGLGVGERHVAGYNAIPGCTVAAVADIDGDKLQEVAARQQVAEATTDWRRVAEHPDIEIVSICSYDDAHVEQAERCLLNGKHVMVEKPVALFRHDAERLLRAQQDSGCHITSNLILRQSPRFREVRRQVQDGTFGEVFYLEGDYIHQILWKIVTGWRAKMDFYCVTYGGGIHLIDLMRWILGDEVVEVAGMGNKVLTRDGPFRWDDTIVSLLRFAGGALAKSLTTFGPQRPQLHRLDVYGTKVAFQNDCGDGHFWTGDTAEDHRPVTTAYPGIEKYDLLPDFVEAVRQGTEPPVTVRDVFRVMDICFACWQSVEEKRTVPVAYLL